MSNFKSINGYKVADEDIRNCVAPKFDPYYYGGNVGDIRLHDDHLYKCIEDTTGGAPWDESQWTEITLGEEIVTLNRGVRDLNNKFAPAGTQYVPMSLYNCTGTITTGYGISMSISPDKTMLNMRGVVRIASFAKTGNKPGVTLTLPFEPLYPLNSNVVVGFYGQKPSEVVYLELVQGDTHARLWVSASHTNPQSGDFDMIVPSTLIPLSAG
jgi:hypothetical protein